MNGKRAWKTALSSLLITVKEEAVLTPGFLGVLGKMEGVTLGEPVGRYLPATVENVDARPVHAWLEGLPEVVQVEVVFCSTVPELYSERQPI